MKKILLSVLAITLTVGLVSGAAYAVFTDTAEVNGIAITAGNADLKVKHDNGNYYDNVNLSMDFSNIYPSWRGGRRLTVKNDSLSNIGLDVAAKMTDFTEKPDNGIYDWDVLRHRIQMAIVEYSSGTQAQYAINDNDPSNSGHGGYLESTDWQTLNTWRHGTPMEITDDAISQNGYGHFVVWVQVDENVDNVIAEAALTNIELELTGTQAN